MGVTVRCLAWAGLWLSLMGTSALGADWSEKLQRCRQMEDPGQRLQCYDELADKSQCHSSTQCSVAVNPPQAKGRAAQWWRRHWAAGIAEGDCYSLLPHRANYLLPASYNLHPNDRELAEAEGDGTYQSMEVAFQVSLKTRLLDNILQRPWDLWFGYTQKSFWQLYDVQRSNPFRETNYEPELLLQRRLSWQVAGGRLQALSLALNHESNGRSGPYSRSWNRLVAQGHWTRGNWLLQPRLWYWLEDSGSREDNPHVDDYVGRAALKLAYFQGQHQWQLKWRNNLRWDQNRGSVQASWSFPLLPRLAGYVQLFSGYGESLLDYDQTTTRLSLGVRLKEWQ